jgi:hypothetical protein
LIALNYSGFFDNEIALYEQVFKDIAQPDNLELQIKTAVNNSPEKYGQLLENKRQSIYDFGVLMGLIEDKARFETITDDMHKSVAWYFEAVADSHKGKLGISWPLPIKKFSSSMMEGLYNDKITHMVQQAVGKNFNFRLPDENKFDHIVGCLKEALRSVRNENTLLSKLRLATALPATAFYLTGMKVYAGNEVVQAGSSLDFNAAMSAATSAYIINSGDERVDASNFFTTWITSYTTLANK